MKYYHKFSFDLFHCRFLTEKKGFIILTNLKSKIKFNGIGIG